MAFTLEKTLDLSYLGESWQGAYLKLRALTFGESTKLASLAIDRDNPDPEQTAKQVHDFLTSHFISGKAYDGDKGALIDVTQDNFNDLPQEIINKAMEVVSGTPSPNSLSA